MPMAFAELEARAQPALLPAVLSYVAGGAGDESTQRANVAAFLQWGLVPRKMVGATRRDLSVELFGMSLPSPLLMAPVGVLGLCAQDGHGTWLRPARPDLSAQGRSCADVGQDAQGLLIQRHVLGGEVFPQVSGGAGAGDQHHVGRQLQQPPQCHLRRGDAEAGGRPGDHRAGEHRIARAARQAERAERHEGDSTADALRQDGGRAAAGEVEHVLHADDLGAVRGVPELLEADVAQADTGRAGWPGPAPRVGWPAAAWRAGWP
jgi:FMN-dependent dehydrogenase